ncbi:ABC transporter permease [Salibacterium aidingense]|uniref:ABC transporter permease n=1 Tax=Salibacterium aidingense TaxID=384933 RepID=UPI003BBEF707
MVQFITKQILVALGQILVVATIVFLLLRFMPGDPAVLVLGSERGGDPEAVALMQEKLGLHQSVFVQYVQWLTDLLQLDFGNSLFNNTPISEYLLERLPKTIELAVAAILIGSIVGVTLGIIAAVKRGGIIDMIVSSIAAAGLSFPVYVTGTVFILIISLQLNILPASGYTDITDDPIDHFKKLLLPAVTISLPLISAIARMTRSSMLEVLHREFVRTLRAKGLPEKILLIKHVFRNAVISVVTVIGLELANLIGGTVLIEFLFNWPGLSTLLVDAINDRDYPLIQGTVIVIAAFYILINRTVELIYGLMDPRTR